MWHCNSPECTFESAVNPSGCLCPLCLSTCSRSVVHCPVEGDKLHNKLHFKPLLKGQFWAEFSESGVKVFATIDARIKGQVKADVTFLLPRGRFYSREGVCADSKTAVEYLESCVNDYFSAREYAKAKGRLYETALTTVQPVLSYQAATQN